MPSPPSLAPLSSSSLSLLEGIRPGGTIEGNLGRHPLGELLVEALRNNLSGRLRLTLRDEARNWLVFRDGVPVQVHLPDVGPSLIAFLVEQGRVDRQLGRQLAQTIRSTGLSESKVVENRALLSGGHLREARFRRAEAQLIRLFDVGRGEFLFTEGRESLNPAEATLLEPLPLLFQGFRSSRAGWAARPYLPPETARVRLGPNFPEGLDPFGLGPELDAAIRAEPSVGALVRQGWAEPEAAAAVACLALVDMLEVEMPRSGGPSPSLRASSARAESSGPAGQPSDAPPGLRIHRRRRPAPEPTPLRGGSNPSLPVEDIDGMSLARRLGPLEDSDYYRLLRVGPDSSLLQIERAFRYWTRRLEQEPSDAGRLALYGLYAEAHENLTNRDKARRYAESGPQLRKRIEAEARLERALQVFGEGRDDEGWYLLRWVRRRDPERVDWQLIELALEWLTQAGSEKSGSPRRGLAAELTRADSVSTRVVLASVLFREGADAEASALLSSSGLQQHPLALRFGGRNSG